MAHILEKPKSKLWIVFLNVKTRMRSIAHKITINCREAYDEVNFNHNFY